MTSEDRNGCQTLEELDMWYSKTRACLALATSRKQFAQIMFEQRFPILALTFARIASSYVALSMSPTRRKRGNSTRAIATDARRIASEWLEPMAGDTLLLCIADSTVIYETMVSGFDYFIINSKSISNQPSINHQSTYLSINE